MKIIPLEDRIIIRPSIIEERGSREKSCLFRLKAAATMICFDEMICPRPADKVKNCEKSLTQYIINE